MDQWQRAYAGGETVLDRGPREPAHVPVGGRGAAASTLITSAVGLLLPFGELDQLVFIVCVVPVVWPDRVMVELDARRLRPIVSRVALSGLGLLAILVR